MPPGSDERAAADEAVLEAREAYRHRLSELEPRIRRDLDGSEA
jgi:hypothetical protein